MFFIPNNLLLDIKHDSVVVTYAGAQSNQVKTNNQNKKIKWLYEAHFFQH